MADLMTDEDKQAAIKAYLEAQNSPQMSVADNNSLPPVAPAPSAAEPIAPPPPSPTFADKTKAINDQLMSQYGKANDDSALKQAQENAQTYNQIADVGHGLETMARANSMAHGGAGVDSGFWQGFKQEGQQGIQQAQNARQSAVNNFLQQHELQRQGAQDVMTKGTWEQQQKEGQAKIDAQDPNSRTSQIAQMAFKSIYKGQPGIQDLDVSNFSAADLAEASKHEDVVSKLNEIKETKKLQLQIQQNILGDKKNEKAKQAFTDASDKVAGKRAPPAVQRAQIGIASGERAMDLIRQYPDLNKMPPEQVHLLNTEIDTMAKGGVGTEGGIKGLEARTMQSNWAKFMSSINGEPTGAQLAGFIEQNKKYLQNMMKTNHDTVNKYGRQIYNGASVHFTPELDAEFKRNNPQLFEEEQASSPEAVGKPPPHGEMVHQNGTTFKWDGMKYVPQPKVAGVK